MTFLIVFFGGLLVFIVIAHIFMWLRRLPTTRMILRLARNAERVTPWLMDQNGWRLYRLNSTLLIEVMPHFIRVGVADEAGESYGVADGPMDDRTEYYDGGSLLSWSPFTTHAAIKRALKKAGAA